MKREEQIIFCSKCLHRNMDFNQGLLCKLSGEKANFESYCPDFSVDETVKDENNNKTLILSDEIKQKISPEVYEKLKMEQNLFAGIISGIVVGLICAIMWGIITLTTGYQIGYMALAIGALVGITIRKFGNGIENIFGILGALISLLSVLLGNFLGIIGFISKSENLKFFETLSRFDFNYLPQIMIESFNIVDILFYGIATYTGYRFSFRNITEKKLMDIITHKK